MAEAAPSTDRFTVRLVVTLLGVIALATDAALLYALAAISLPSEVETQIVTALITIATASLATLGTVLVTTRSTPPPAAVPDPAQ